MKKRNSYFLLFFVFSFSSCRKPAENKLAGNWKVEKILVNEIDRTSDINNLLITYYKLSGWESDKSKYDRKPMVNLIVDTLNAHWEDSCYYYSWHLWGFQ